MNAIVQYQVSDIERMARAFASSKLFGVQNEEQAVALCLIAQAEGRHPASAAQDYYIVNGRPSKKADAMLRDFLANGGKVQWHVLSDDKADATFSHPAGGAARIDWTLARAKQAGIGGQMWNKYPRQMLRARCVSEGVRTVFPMATSGMYVPEEAQDIPEAESPSATAPGPATAQMLEDQRRPRTDERGIKRLSSAEAKRKGLDKEISDAIWGCTSLEDLDDWEAEFGHHTAECPLSWLDTIRNDVLLRREAIQKEGSFDAEFDQAFAGTVGPREPAEAVDG